MFRIVLLSLLTGLVFSCDKEEDKRASVSDVNETHSGDTEVPSISSRVDQSISLLFDAAADIEKASKDYDKVSGGLSLSSDGAVDTLAKNAVALKNAATTLDKEMKEAAASEKDLKDLKPKEVSAENVKATETALNSAKSLFYKKLADFQELGGEAKNLSSELIEKSEEADTKMDAAYAKEVAAQRERSQVESNMRTLKQAVMDDLEKRQGAADKLKKETDQFANAQKGLSNVTEEVDEDVEELKETNDELSKTNSKLTANQTVLKNYTTSLKTTVTKTDTEVLQGLQTSLVTFKNTIDDLSGTTDELSQIQVRHSSLLAALLSGPVAVIMQEISRLQGAVDILTSLINNETRSDIRSQLTSVKNTVAASVRNLNTAIADIQANIATQQKLSGTAKTTLDRQRKIVVDQNLVYEKQSALVNQLKELVEEQKKLLASQESAVKKNDALLASQRKILAEQAKIIAELDEKVDRQKNYIAANKNYLAEVTKYLGEEFVRIKAMREKLAQIPDPTGVIEVCTKEQFLQFATKPKARIRLICDIDMQFTCLNGQKADFSKPGQTCSYTYEVPSLGYMVELDGNGKTISHFAVSIAGPRLIKNIAIIDSYFDAGAGRIFSLETWNDNKSGVANDVFISGVFDTSKPQPLQTFLGDQDSTSSKLGFDMFIFSRKGTENGSFIAELPNVTLNLFLRFYIGGADSRYFTGRIYPTAHLLDPGNSIAKPYYCEGLYLDTNSRDVSLAENWCDGIFINSTADNFAVIEDDRSRQSFYQTYFKPGFPVKNSFNSQYSFNNRVFSLDSDDYLWSNRPFTNPNAMMTFKKAILREYITVGSTPVEIIGANVGKDHAVWHQPKLLVNAITPVKALPQLRSKLEHEATAMMRYYGFKAPDIRFSYNVFGMKEKWLMDAANRKYFILEGNRALYRFYNGTKDTFLQTGKSEFLGYLLPEHFDDPGKIFSLWTRESNLSRFLKIKAKIGVLKHVGSPIPGGLNEKWFMANKVNYFILPNGTIFKWDGSKSSTDINKAFPGASELIMTGGKELYNEWETLF